MTHRMLACLSCLVVVAGCGGGKPPETPAGGSGEPAPSVGAPEATPVPATFSEQVAQGQKLYGEHCANCHGASGEGGKAPAVVGLDKGALPLDPPPSAKYRKTKFKTVADIADFVVKNMPADSPGTLTAEQYFSILAFDLKANGIDLGEKKLDATLAPTLDVPR
jgi:polar amino acid transport system substrate-binding protein